jgi:hypothetical protein
MYVCTIGETSPLQVCLVGVDLCLFSQQVSISDGKAGWSEQQGMAKDRSPAGTNKVMR